MIDGILDFSHDSCMDAGAGWSMVQSACSITGAGNSSVLFKLEALCAACVILSWTCSILASHRVLSGKNYITMYVRSFKIQATGLMHLCILSLRAWKLSF